MSAGSSVTIVGSGLDVALTVMELSAGVCHGLDRQSAAESITCFRAEADRSRSVDAQNSHLVRGMGERHPDALRRLRTWREIVPQLEL